MINRIFKILSTGNKELGSCYPEDSSSPQIHEVVMTLFSLQFGDYNSTEDIVRNPYTVSQTKRSLVKNIYLFSQSILCLHPVIVLLL